MTQSEPDISVSLEDLVYATHQKGWDWTELSANPNISLDFVYTNLYLEEGWDIYAFSGNPNITWNIVEQNPREMWDGNALLANCKDLTLDIIYREYHRKRKRNRGISTNWELCTWAHNPNITWEMILKVKNSDWYHHPVYFEHNSNITEEIVLANPDVEWKMWILCENPNISWEFLKKHTKFLSRWEWCIALSKAPWEFISQQIILHEHWGEISGSPNVTWDIVCKNPQYPWVYCGTRTARYTSWYNLPYGLSMNSNITLSIVLENMTSKDPKNWNWKELSSNPSILPSEVLNNPHLPWDYRELSRNKFTRYNTLLKQKQRKEHAYNFRDALAEIECKPMTKKIPTKVHWVGQEYLNSQEAMEKLTL